MSLVAVEQARELIGQQVVVTSGAGLEYRGKLVAVEDKPHLVVSDRAGKTWTFSPATVERVERDG